MFYRRYGCEFSCGEQCLFYQQYHPFGGLRFYFDAVNRARIARAATTPEAEA
jgi:hypothetical protein